MSIRKILFAGTALSLAFAPMTVRADATADARKVIQANYDKANTAVGKKDIKGMFAFFTPDYEQVEKSGSKPIKLADLRHGIEQQFQQPALQSIKSKAVVQKLALKGKEATVTISEQMELTVANPQTHKSMKFASTGTSEDLWVKGGTTGWLLKHSKQLTSQQTLDGKPFGSPGR